jgi:hypothetical protein
MNVARERLPNRRRSISFPFEYQAVRYTGTVSVFQDGRLAEIFIDCFKPGSAIAEHAATSAVLASLLLQNGVPVTEIMHSIAGPLATALAKALDIIAAGTITNSTAAP